MAGRVLLVEDDASIGEALVSSLRSHAYDVAWERTGAAGLAHAAAAPVDLVLLDLGLPDLDGVEVCRQLRATSASKPSRPSARANGSAIDASSSTSSTLGRSMQAEGSPVGGSGAAIWTKLYPRLCGACRPAAQDRRRLISNVRRSTCAA